MRMNPGRSRVLAGALAGMIFCSLPLGIGSALAQGAGNAAEAAPKQVALSQKSINGLIAAQKQIRAVEAQGASPKSYCAVNSGQALQSVPGFEGAPDGYSPLKLRQWFLTLPGVQSKRHQDGDPANNHDVLLRQKDGSVEGYRDGHLVRAPG